jgi:hypothetical protein
LVELEYQENPQSHRLLEQKAMLEFRRGHNTAGREYLREIADLYPLLAAPYLIEIRTHCKNNAIPAKLLAQAEAKLAEGPLTAFDGNALLTLTNKVINDKCPALQLDALRELATAAAENSRVHTAPVHVSALVNASRVTAASGMAEESQNWAFQAVDAGTDMGIQRFKKTVEETASIQSVFGQPADLEAFLDGITQRYQEYLSEHDLSLSIAARPDDSTAPGASR